MTSDLRLRGAVELALELLKWSIRLSLPELTVFVAEEDDRTRGAMNELLCLDGTG